MKHKKLIIALLSAISIIGCLIFSYQYREVIAATFGIQVTGNGSNDERATRGLIDNNYPTNDGTTTPRYLQAGGASTTLQVATDGIERASFAIEYVASTTGFLQFEFQYGLNAFTHGGTSTREWFGGDNIVSQTGTSSVFTIHASSSALEQIPIINTGTSTRLINVPTFLAPYVRIRATFLGTNGAIWMTGLGKKDATK